MRLLQFVVNNPKTVAKVLALVVGAIVVVFLSFSVEIIPTWIGLLGIAVLPGYAAWVLWGRVSLIWNASEVPAGQVSSGVVEVSGTARPAQEGDYVTPDARDGEYVAYKRLEKVDTDPNDDDEPPLMDADSRSTDVSTVPIYVEDDTGEVLVDTNNADVRLAWDDIDRGARRTKKWAGLESGDAVTVYGTAMPPAQRNPPGLVDSLSDVSDSMQGRDFDGLAAEEEVIISKNHDQPYLVLSDRSGLELLGRQLLYFLVAAVATVGLVGAAILGIFGSPVV